jgi:hypothetical protein
VNRLSQARHSFRLRYRPPEPPDTRGDRQLITAVTDRLGISVFPPPPPPEPLSSPPPSTAANEENSKGGYTAGTSHVQALVDVKVSTRSDPTTVAVGLQVVAVAGGAKGDDGRDHGNRRSASQESARTHQPSVGNARSPDHKRALAKARRRVVRHSIRIRIKVLTCWAYER